MPTPAAAKKLSPEEAKKLTEFIELLPGDLERVSHRTPRRPEIVEPDPAWPERFAQVANRIREALGPVAVAIEHVGSTSVPGLAAKPIIDIDLTVPDTTDEAAYVPALERAGFQFLFREPRWHEHRFFGLAEPYTNLHIFGPGAAEMTRHVMFRDWLRENPEDRAKYVAAKRAAAEASQASGEFDRQYNARKHGVIQEIYANMFKAYGISVEETPQE